MSKWLTMLNELKSRSPREYFTTTQLDAYQTLIELLDLPGQRLNLSGVHGTGKTFVAWGVARAIGIRYLTLPDQLYNDAAHSNWDGEVILIDNAPTREDEVRKLLSQASLLNINSLVLISTQPSALKMRRIELSLPTEAEIEQTLKNLRQLGFYLYGSLPTQPNFWQVLQGCI